METTSTHDYIFKKRVIDVLFKLKILNKGEEEKKIMLMNATTIENIHELKTYTYHIQYRDGYFKLECDFSRDHANIIFVNDYSDNSSFNDKDSFHHLRLDKEIILLLDRMDSKNNKKPRQA